MNKSFDVCSAMITAPFVACTFDSQRGSFEPPVHKMLIALLSQTLISGITANSTKELDASR